MAPRPRGQRSAAGLTALCLAVAGGKAASAQDGFVFFQGDMSCEDAGYRTIATEAQCMAAAVELDRAPKGWGGKVHVGYGGSYACGCLYLESLGNVELWLPPGCNPKKTCSDLDGCFCQRERPEGHAPAPATPEKSTSKVNCGGHFMPACADCPEGRGSSWCNGDCSWSAEQGCIPSEAMEDNGESAGSLEGPRQRVQARAEMSQQDRQRAARAAVESAIADLLGTGGLSSEDKHSWFSEETTTTTTAPAYDPDKCPGSLNVEGYGRVELTNAYWDVPGRRAERVEVTATGSLRPRMGGRTYFADSCRQGDFDNEDYVAMKLLGRAFRYTVDLSGATCGCNAALYLTSLAQNSRPTKCQDHYCDANSVCGEACAEIDIQEANAFAFRSTLHTSRDGSGIGGGYGGGGAGWSMPRDWTGLDYRPGSDCIDTSKPFQVEARFPVDASGQLQAMATILSQDGHDCTVSMCLQDYVFAGLDGMAELSRALAEGMTPIVSYWSSPILVNFDGLGPDHKGPCKQDDPSVCAESVSFYNFSVQDIPLGAPTCPQRCSSKDDNCRQTGCCNDARLKCFEKDASWASCKPSCEPGIDPSEPLAAQTPWTCRSIGAGGVVTGTPPPPPCAGVGENCKASACCADADLMCFEKDAGFATCKEACEPGIDESEDSDFQTPWTCKLLSEESGAAGNAEPQQELIVEKDQRGALAAESLEHGEWRLASPAAAVAVFLAAIALILALGVPRSWRYRARSTPPRAGRLTMYASLGDFAVLEPRTAEETA